jgi:hypothetical protein
MSGTQSQSGRRGENSWHYRDSNSRPLSRFGRKQSLYGPRYSVCNFLCLPVLHAFFSFVPSLKAFKVFFERPNSLSVISHWSFDQGYLTDTLQNVDIFIHVHTCQNVYKYVSTQHLYALPQQRYRLSESFCYAQIHPLIWDLILYQIHITYIFNP